jgi:hypothetical protein
MNAETKKKNKTPPVQAEQGGAAVGVLLTVPTPLA